jgi:hypothetical protein
MAVSLALTVWPSVALAQPVIWKTYTIPATGTFVDFPPRSSLKKPAGPMVMASVSEHPMAEPTSRFK